MKQRLTMLLVSLFLCVGLANAQTQINGTVTSADDGQPVIGASVMITGTKTGVVTNVDGKFSLTSNKKNPMITVSYIGMKSQTLHGTQNMQIVLHSDAKSERTRTWLWLSVPWTMLPCVIIIHDCTKTLTNLTLCLSQYCPMAVSIAKQNIR